MSATIKGQQYQLAGFVVCQKGALVDIFAKFCGIDQDPANLPETTTRQLFANKEPMEMPVFYPTLSVEDIVDALVGPKNLIPTARDQIAVGVSPQELLRDLGEDQFAGVLVKMGQAKKAFLSGNGTSTFIPVAP